MKRIELFRKELQKLNFRNDFRTLESIDVDVFALQQEIRDTQMLLETFPLPTEIAGIKMLIKEVNKNFDVQVETETSSSDIYVYIDSRSILIIDFIKQITVETTKALTENQLFLAQQSAFENLPFSEKEKMLVEGARAHLVELLNRLDFLNEEIEIEPEA